MTPGDAADWLLVGMLACIVVSAGIGMIREAFRE